MLNNKSVLITGGTGTLGRALTKSLFISQSKGGYFSKMSRNSLLWPAKFPEAIYSQVRYLIGDVRDYERLERAMQGVEFVIHTAAMKHVHIAEYNPNGYN